MSLTRLVEESLEKYGEYVALAFEGRQYTNVEQHRTAGRVANALRRLGVEPGDRVMVMLPNCPEVLQSYGGILRAGGVIVPVIFLLGDAEVAHILADSESKVVITSSDMLWKVDAQIGVMPTLRHVLLVDGGGDGRTLSFAGEIAGEPESFPTEERGADDLAVILYTSGTTGVPKGVALSHDNLESNARSAAALYRARPDGLGRRGPAAVAFLRPHGDERGPHPRHAGVPPPLVQSRRGSRGHPGLQGDEHGGRPDHVPLLAELRRGGPLRYADDARLGIRCRTAPRRDRGAVRAEVRGQAHGGLWPHRGVARGLGPSAVGRQEARLRGPADSGRARLHPGRRWPASARRRGRRGLREGAQRDGGLLSEPRGDGARHPRGVAAHGRHGAPRRGRASSTSSSERKTSSSAAGSISTLGKSRKCSTPSRRPRRPR